MRTKPMIECNIYSGYKGKLSYQETDDFNNLLDAELYAQEVSEMDAKEFGYDIDECLWLAIETDKDCIPLDNRVGINYIL